MESTEQDFRSRNWIIEFLKTRFLKRCSAFVVPGKSSFQYVKNYGARDEEIFTAPNAVDTELFLKRRLPSARTQRSSASRCNCHHVFSCSWAGWSGKKESLTCLRPMAN